jgi:hypothetical protein
MTIDIDTIEDVLNDIDEYLSINRFSDVEKFIVYMLLALYYKKYKLNGYDDEDMERIFDAVYDIMRILV